MDKLFKSIESGNIYNGYILIGSSEENSLQLAKQMSDKMNTSPYIYENPNMEQARKIQSDLYQDAQNSEYKVAIIVGDKISEQVQNAMLKTIEEPKSNFVIIFVLTNISILLATIISRCVKINIGADSRQDIIDYIGKEDEISIRYCHDSKYRAKQILEDKNFCKNRNRAINILENLLDKRVTYLEKTEKEFIVDYFKFFECFFRDVLKNEEYWFFDKSDLIKKYKNNFTFLQIISMIKVVNEKNIIIMMNTNPQLVYDSFMLTILEVIK